jgi:hypothetical protein
MIRVNRFEVHLWRRWGYKITGFALSGGRIYRRYDVHDLTLDVDPRYRSFWWCSAFVNDYVTLAIKYASLRDFVSVE